MWLPAAVLAEIAASAGRMLRLQAPPRPHPRTPGPGEPASAAASPPQATRVDTAASAPSLFRRLKAAFNGEEA